MHRKPTFFLSSSVQPVHSGPLASMRSRLIFALLIPLLGLFALPLTTFAQTATLEPSWNEQLPATIPPAREGATMVYDAITGTVVLFGGESSSGLLNDTWTWNGTNWTQESPIVSPPARLFATMSYDASTGTVVLFGGYGSSGYLNDTWTWDGTNWTQQSPTLSPTARYSATMAYDAATGTVVLYGGNGSALLSDTWTWNGTNWTEAASGGPTARESAAMSYDASTGTIVLFGGLGTYGFLNDTWTWDGTTWTGQSPAGSPSAREAETMAYDAATGTVVLFGGAGNSGPLNDTWTWNGTSWTQQLPVTSPPIRYWATMDYDASTGAVVLFGGNSTISASDTWTYQFGAVNLGVANVCPAGVNAPSPCSQSATLSFVFTGPDTGISPSVVTQGATGLDFTDAGGSCDTNGTTYTYNVGDTCTVNVQFAPTLSHIRYGAVVLKDTNGVAATGYIYGTGTGPQIAFAPPAQSTLGAGFSLPKGLAVDGSGNIYVAEEGGDVAQMPPGCASSSCVTTLGGGFPAGARGVAVDGAGNVYVAAVNGLKAMPPGCASSSCVATLGGGISNPAGVAVDGSGNIYFTAGGGVAQMPPGCASSSCITTLGGGFSDPAGVAVDGSGNIYIADQNNQAVKEMPPGCASSSCVTTLGGGFNGPFGVAVDGAGNIYVGDLDNGAVKEMPPGCASSNCVTTLSKGLEVPSGVAVDGSGNVYVSTYQGVKELLYVSPPALSFPTTTGVGVLDSTDGPIGFTVENIGNAPLIFALPAAGVNPSVSAGFVWDNTSTCMQTPAGGSAFSVAAAGSCSIEIDLQPTIEGANTGSVVVTDNNLNATAATQAVGLSGTGTTPAVTITLSPTSLPGATGGSTYSQAITASGGTAPYTFTVTSGALPSGLNLSSAGLLAGTPTAAGTFNFTIQATDSLGYVGSQAYSQNVAAPAVNLAPSQSLGSESVGSASSNSTTLNFTFYTAVTLGSTTVLTQGATGLDFTDAGGGTCTEGTAYSAGDTCTLNVFFKPTAPGVRYGAAELLDGSGNLIATGYLQGTGTGPLVNFLPGTQTTLGSGFNDPSSVAVDGSGNIFVADWLNDEVKEIVAGSGYSTIKILGSGFNRPLAVALDGSGNVFVADYGNSAVKEIVAAGGYTTVNTLGGGFSTPAGVAVDGNGNVFVGDYGNNAVKEILASSGYRTINTLGSGFSNPFGVAVDGNGNVFVADLHNNVVKEIIAAGGYTTVNTVGSGFNLPYDVAVDGNGNLFVADTNNFAIKELVAASGYTTIKTLGSGFYYPYGLTVDGSGNVLVADTGNSRVEKLDLADPPSLSFPTATQVGLTDSTDGPLPVTVENNGNAALTAIAPGLTAPTDFTQMAGSGTPPDCTASFSLAAGASCNLSIEFAPVASGTLNESLVLTDNNLNVSGTTQSIGLSGTGVAGVSVTIGTSPTGLSFSINGTLYSTTQTPSLTIGTQYTLTTSSPQIGGPGVQYIFSGWSDGTTSLTDTLTPTASTTSDVAGFTTQYLLTVTAGSGGTLAAATSPNGFYNAGTAQTLAAMANAGYYFTGWTGANSPSDIASATSATTTVAMNGPENLTANFAPIPGYQVTTLNDDSTSNAANCTTQSPNCTLRDALAAASAAGAGNITFSPSAFSSPTTIQLSSGLTIPSNTLISGLTMGTGPTTTNLITLRGGGTSNPFSIFTVASGVANAVIANLTITNGYAQFGGGIYNQGTLTITNSTISNNQSGGQGAGIFNYYGGTLTINDSTISGNSTPNDDGGGISSFSTLTINQSTFSGNTAQSGGAIFDWSNLYVTNSTFSGNSAGIYIDGGTLAMSNSIVAGNSGGDLHVCCTLTSYIDEGGNLANNDAGGTIITVALAPLGNYGGPTQTMVPLPSSLAICGGVAANILTGVTTDQRGYPNTNTTYAGYSSSSPCVDSGAVQTNYALSFNATQEPPATGTVPGTAMSPAPAVTVTESGNAFTGGSASVSVTDANSDLTTSPATATTSTSSGQAAFSNLIFTGATSNDTLTASLALIPNGLNLTTTSTSFSVAAVTVPPAITSVNNATFVVGALGSFTVKATGSPSPTLSESGTLPSGVSFNSTTGVLSGTPAAGTGGTYSITFTASNGASPNAVQSFTLTVDQAPAITSAPSAVFVLGTAGSFTLTATGFPAPTFSLTSGTLPSGVTFNATTHVLSGTPGAGTDGIYAIQFTASDGVESNAVQSFTLTVGQLPAVTSAAKTTFTVGTAGTFTVTGTGYPAPTFSETGALPSGVTLSAAGVLSGTPAAGTGGVYSISITANNAAGTSAAQTFTLTVDQAPAITSAAAATFTTGTAGSFTVRATGYPVPTFTRTGTLPAGVTFTAATGALSGTPGASAGGSYSLTFTATSSVGTSAQTFTLTVDQLPAVTSAAKTTFTVGTAGTFTVTGTGYPAPTFSETGALPGGVTLSAAGVLSGTPAAGTGGVYSISITASNAAGTSAAQTFTLTVDQAPAITSAASATFTTGTAGTFTVTATGYPAPTFTRTGTLPTGVTFTAATGVLRGTPGASAGGSYSLTFTATSSVGTSAQTFTLTVDQLPAVTSAAKTTFTVGTAGTFTVTGTGYPAPTFSETGALPGGVTLSAAGVLSGTPAAGTGGVYSISITASNAAGTSAAQTFTLTVDQAPAIISAASATFTTGTAGTFTVTATGYPAPTFTRTGTLPTGVTFTAATGVLRGTPSKTGTYTLTFTATNSVGTSTAQTFTLTVNQAPAITSAAKTTFTVGTAGTFTMTASGYPAPTFSEIGALPSGVTLSAAGVLSGTPAAGTGGVYSISITASNAAGTSAAQTFTLTVDQAPAITSAASATFTTGTAGSFTVTATGYPAPTFTRTGTLPTGVTFNGTSGVLSGTPSKTGTYTLTFTATNSVGTSTAQTFTLTVN